MKRLMPSVVLTALFVAACNTSTPPDATSEIVVEEAAPAAATETPVPATEAPVSHAFETGSASLEIEVPLDGRLAEPVEIETEHGVRFSAEAGTLLRTLSGMFVTGPITIGIDDAGDFSPLPDDIAVDGVVRVYVLVQMARGPELLNVRFEPAGQLQISLTDEDAGEWATYSPAARGGGYLQGSLPEAAAAAVSAVLAAPANSDGYPQSNDPVVIIPGIQTASANTLALVVDGSTVVFGGIIRTRFEYEVEDPIKINVNGWGGYYQHHEMLVLLEGFDVVDGGYYPGSGGSFMSQIVIYNYTGSVDEILQIFQKDWQATLDEGEIYVTTPRPPLPVVTGYDNKLKILDAESLETLWETQLAGEPKQAILSSTGESIYALVITNNLDGSDDNETIYATGFFDSVRNYVDGAATGSIPLPDEDDWDDCFNTPATGADAPRCGVINIPMSVIALSPRGDILYDVTDQGSFGAYDARTLEHEWGLEGLPSGATDIALAPHGGLAFVVTPGQVSVVDLLRRLISTPVIVQEDETPLIGSVSHAGDKLALAYSPGGVGILDLGTRQIVGEFATGGDAGDIVWTPDGGHILVANPADKKVTVFNSETFTAQDVLVPGGPNHIATFTGSSGEPYVFISSQDGTLANGMLEDSALVIENILSAPTITTSLPQPAFFNATLSFTGSDCGYGDFQSPFSFDIRDSALTITQLDAGNITSGSYYPATGEGSATGSAGSGKEFYNVRITSDGTTITIAGTNAYTGPGMPKPTCTSSVYGQAPVP